MEEKLWNSNYIKIWTGNFIVHFSFTLIVPLLPLFLTDTFGANKDTIGLVLAGYTVMGLMIRPFGGFIVDSFPRKTVLLICYFFFFAIFAGYMLAGTLTMFAIFRTLHGAPFGAASVSASTVAIDVLPASRRSEGMGYYGLSNNLATAIGPVLAIGVLHACRGNYQVLFAMSMALALVGLILDATLKLPKRDYIPQKRVISLDRFFLIKGFKEAITIACFSFSYGLVSTYVAIYGREELGITGGTGMFFSLLAIGLMISRLTGARALKKNLVSRNAAMGMVVSLFGYTLFAAVHSPVGYYGAALIVGLGNGHMYPAFLTMFINLAEHNQRGTANSSILTAWDAGVGLGVVIGGFLAEILGYSYAFWMAVLINAIGVCYYFMRTRTHFETNKLR